MNLQDIQKNAQFYQRNYLETFYLITTYSNKSFILIGEKENFPHLMGIRKNTYRSNGYRNPRSLYKDILDNVIISTNIIPNNISTTSKMYKKALNFQDSKNIFWNNDGVIAINYEPASSPTNLNNVDILLTDISKGYMLGWKRNKDVQVGSEIKLVKYCITTWIDESNGNISGKEKYLPNQDVDLIKEVLAFNKNSELIKQKTYHYSSKNKENLLKVLERRNANLLIDSRNQYYYITIAQEQNIHCKINGIQY